MRAWTGAALLACAAAPSLAAGPTARDHGGNRIESLRQTRFFGPARERGLPNRNCTEDRRWCAYLIREPSDGRWTLHIRVKEGGRTRRHLYALPLEHCCGPGRGFAIWDRIVREPRGGALIGLDFSRETGDRKILWSYQRRLFLLRVPARPGGVPVPVLEAPLSGVVYQPACASAYAQHARTDDCLDSYTFSTLWTLLPSIGPVEPANLVMVAEAATRPGSRSRRGGLVRREPLERIEETEVRDPVCTYTRSYYFDEELGRYLPDAPLPDCGDFLEP